MAQQLEDAKAALVTAHHLPIDQDRPDPEVVHGLDNQRIPGGPVMTVEGQPADAHWVSAGHEALAIVLIS